MTPIAVVGIDCRFPGAPDKDAFWRLLMDGVVTDTEVPSQRWDIDTHYHPDGVAGSMNSRRAHFIDDIDAFDNDFFGIAPIEAAALDPQQRLLLQAAWRALEDAGINPVSLAGTPTGVYVGMMSSEWGSLQMLDFAGVTPFRGAGSGYFMTANRISYHLNLTGPSMAIDSACSSSLMAVHQGCAALRSGETDTVIAAGSNLLLTPALSIFYTQAGLSAADGRCKPFGVGADGIGRGEGVAAVVLRRLDDAVADGQPIYAVVKSSVANHDGRSNGITAPSRRSQVELMRRALSLAEVEAGQIRFVEAHGTGTVLGDMIEANALGDVHKTRGGEPCLLGSVKGNIGHTEGSAGIAAFIKVCLALHLRILPPTVFGDRANPGLRLEAQGLRLADSPQQLPPNGALGAVSSFGLGGSNAHAVLESAPAAALPEPGATGVLTLSAPSEQALRRNADLVATALHNLGDQQLTSWCRATNVVKRSHRHRLVLEGNRGTLVDGLREFLADTRADLVSSAPMRKVPAGVGLLCSGQGTQYPGMTRPIYDANPIYREHLDAAAAALDPHLPSGLFAAIFGDGPDLDHTSVAQPALFAVSYALGKTLLQSGIRPAFGIGHSVGEIASACLAGVLSVDDAARLVAVRGRLMGSLPAGGAMIAVDLGVEQAEALIVDEPGCAIAAVNGPRAVVIAGNADAVAQARAAVTRQGGKAVNLAVSHAFHSPLMEPIVAEFRRRAVGAGAGSRGVPAVLHRGRQRSRGPRNGHRLLGQPDLFARAVFRRSPGRYQCGENRLCRRGRSAAHTGHAGPAVRTAAADPVADIVRRTGFRWNGAAGRSCDAAARRVLARPVAVVRPGRQARCTGFRLTSSTPPVGSGSTAGSVPGADGPARDGHAHRRAKTVGAGAGRARARGAGLDRRRRRLFGRRDCPVQPAQR